MNKRARLVKLHITRRYPGDLPPIFINEIPDDMPRNDIFDWLKAHYPLSDKNIISISAELIEPDGCEYRSDGDHDWILVKREL